MLQLQIKTNDSNITFRSRKYKKHNKIDNNNNSNNSNYHYFCY